jgi:type IV secretion system protein VirB6
MAAGAMLLLFKFTMAFLVGVGPIFILALMFDQTKDLFKKWLFYVIGTLFSMSMLSVVSAMVLKLSTKVAIALWVSKSINGMLGTDTEGLSSQALQQGGIGMLLTVLIITMPTVAAALWQGNMGSFMHFSAFSGGGASSPGPQGQPPGSYMPSQRPSDGTRSVDQVGISDMNASRASGTPSTAPISAMPGYRGAANVNDSNRIV